MQAINALPTQMPIQKNTIELNDIHVPEQISNYPVAYGWWLLAIILIIITVFSFIKIRKNNQRNFVKKQALAQLKNNPDLSVNDTIALLKWAAMHYFSRGELAKLFGDSLQSFLIEKLPTKHQESFTKLSEQAFINQYQDQNNIQQSDINFYNAAILWLTHALPPKVSKSTNKSNNITTNAITNVNQGASL